MKMGKRIWDELLSRGMKPVDLCALVPELDIGTLSAIYKRDSRNSKFAPEIAKALGVELHWLLTGEGAKMSSVRPQQTALSEEAIALAELFMGLSDQRKNDAKKYMAAIADMSLAETLAEPLKQIERRRLEQEQTTAPEKRRQTDRQ